MYRDITFFAMSPTYNCNATKHMQLKLTLPGSKKGVVKKQAMVKTRKNNIDKNTNRTKQKSPEGIRQKAGQKTRQNGSEQE